MTLTQSPTHIHLNTSQKSGVNMSDVNEVHSKMNENEMLNVDMYFSIRNLI